MWKKSIVLGFSTILLAGCSATFSNLTPMPRTRNPDNLYRVEVAFDSHQQTLRWNSIKPMVVVDGEYIPMHPTQLMTNRWEALIPAKAGANQVNYQYKFDFEYNAFGKPKKDSATSRGYTLRILN